MADDIERFDLVVIGSGPAGEKGAVQAAYFGKKVALVEKAREVGGACVHTGTLPSKTLREAALYVTGFQRRNLYGMTLDIDRDASLRQLMGRLHAVIGQQVAQIARNLDRHGVATVARRGRVRRTAGDRRARAGFAGGTRRLTADAFLDRDRQLAAPAARRPVRRHRRRGLRHDPRPRPHPDVAGRRRRRRDRLRVRLPVRRARHQDHHHRGARRADGLPRRRDVARAQDRARARGAPGPARRRRARHRADPGRAAARRAEVGQAARGRQGPLLGGARRQHRRARARARGREARRQGAHPGQRALPDLGAADLRRRRRRRQPGAGVGVDGAGTRRHVPRVRLPLQDQGLAADAVRRLHHPRDLDGRRDRGRSAHARRRLRGRARRATTTTRAGRSSASPTAR